MTTVTLDKTRPADPFNCPSWCVEDHAGDDPSDSFHRGDYVTVELPAGVHPADDSDPTEHLMTNLVMHTVDPRQSCIAIGDTWSGFELETPEQIDVYLSNLTDHLFQVRAMRDQLAVIQAGA